jgi:hypothetical protein
MRNFLPHSYLLITQKTVISIVFLLLNRNLSINIGQKNTIDWDFRYDSRYSRRYCVVPSAETFSTRVMGRCRNNNPKDRQTTKE